MSNIKEGQICPFKKLDSMESCSNKEFTKLIMQEFKFAKGRNAVKYIAQELKVNPDSVKNWLYKGNGMTALHLFLMIKKYDFIRELVLNSME